MNKIMCGSNFGNLMVTHYKFIIPFTVSVYTYILYISYQVTKLLYKTILMRYYKIKKNKISLYNTLNRSNFGNLVTRAFLRIGSLIYTVTKWLLCLFLGVTRNVERFCF